MEIKIGDKFKSVYGLYTVTSVDGDKIGWDCIGRKLYMKRVSRQMIEEWIADERLVKIN